MRIILLISIIFLIASNDLFSQWERMNNSSVTTRHHPVTFTLNNTAYLVSGTSLQSSPLGTNSFFKYDEENDSWIQMEDFPGSPRSFAYAATYNGKAYFGFGSQQVYLNDLWEFDPETESWRELTPCSCAGRNHPVFVAYDGKIYVGLGNSFSNLNDFWVYDIATDSWNELDPLPGFPRHHPFHFTAGGYIYAGFGHAGPNYYADWYRYDPVNNQWTRMADHPNGPRVAGQEFNYGGYGFVISGDGQNHLNLQEGEFYRYNHEDDTWTRLPNHPGSPPDSRVGRWAPGSFVLNDHVYFFGGVNRGGGFLYSEVWRFNLTEVVSSTDDQFTNDDFLVYPNPSDGLISFPEEFNFSEKWDVKVFDSSGRLVFSDLLKQSKIDVTHLSSGLYQIQIRSEKGKIHQSKFTIVE